MASSEIGDRIAAVRERIDAACATTGREPREVRLLLATKTLDADRVLDAVRAGADLVGENRVQELVAKGPALAELEHRPEVHLIGHLQSNKVNAALRWADGIESVDSLDLAERIAARCAAADRTLDVMVQVNTSGEPSKFGASPEDAPKLAIQVAALPGLRLRGFMTIGANTPDERLVRASYARLRELRDAVLATAAPGTDTARELSMGMSRDLEQAIAEGATIIRVGTAVFGDRPTPPTAV